MIKLILQITFKLESALRKAARDKRISGNPHLIMILDKPLERFPWESMRFLSQKSISRIPSLPFLLEHLKSSKKLFLDQKKVLYLLNPAKDLIHTQELFEGPFEKYDFNFF